MSNEDVSYTLTVRLIPKGDPNDNDPREWDPGALAEAIDPNDAYDVSVLSVKKDSTERV